MKYACVALCGVILSPFAASQDEEPTHAGKPARYWIDRLAAGHEDAEEAVLAIGPYCIPLLIERLSDDRPWRVERAIRSMGTHAAPALLTQLRSAKTRHRLLALSLLLELDERPRELAAILPALLADEYPEVRRLACHAAATIDKTAGTGLLALVKDDHAEVQAAAIGALRVIGDDSEAVGAALVGVLRDPDVATTAAWTLIRLRTRVDDAVRYLVSSMEAAGGSKRADRVNAIAGLGPLAKAALPALHKQLGSTYAMTKMEAAWAVYTVGGDAKTAVAVVKASLQEEDRFNICYAAWVACRFGPVAADVAPHLVPILDHQDSWIRRNAALALGYLGPVAMPSVRKLEEMLQDRDSSTGKLDAPCFAAAASLARLGEEGPQIARLLAETLEQRDNLGGLEPAALRYAWRHGTLSAKDVVDRIVARGNSGFFPYPLHTAPQLLRLLGDISPEARAAIPMLRKLQDGRYEIRTAAGETLRRIQD